jgi:hypothetical protein
VYERTVNASGTVQIDRYTYSVGTQYRGEKVYFEVDATTRVFQISVMARFVKTLPIQGLHSNQMALNDYVTLIKQEADLISRYHQMAWHKEGELPS